MKKLILATIACAFLASPAFANEFIAEQTKVLDNIAGKLESFKDDAEKMDFLTQKKACVVKAKDIDGLKACLATFPPMSK